MIILVMVLVCLHRLRYASPCQLYTVPMLLHAAHQWVYSRTVKGASVGLMLPDCKQRRLAILMAVLVMGAVVGTYAIRLLQWHLEPLSWGDMVRTTLLLSALTLMQVGRLLHEHTPVIDITPEGSKTYYDIVVIIFNHWEGGMLMLASLSWCTVYGLYYPVHGCVLLATAAFAAFHSAQPIVMRYVTHSQSTPAK